MKTKHTPTPWEPIPYDTNCGKDYAGKWWIRGPADADGWRTIADLAKYGEEAEANARLIAAAPELLALLQDAAGMLDHLTGENLTTYARTFAALARAAIARATAA